MDGSFTNVVINNILRLYYNGSGITPPTTLYFGLATNYLTKSSIGTSPQEPNDVFYKRVAMTPNTTDFTYPANGILSNNISITWPTPKKDWGTIKSVFVADASGIAGGNLINFYNLTSTKVVSSGDTPLTFPSGSFNIIFS